MVDMSTARHGGRNTITTSLEVGRGHTAVGETEDLLARDFQPNSKRIKFTVSLVNAGAIVKAV